MYIWNTKLKFIIEKEIINMQNKKKKKTGLFASIKESMTKTGGCCGPGETCGDSAKKDDKVTVNDTKDSNKNDKR